MPQKVVVVGNSASGLDIGSQIARVCRPPLLISRRSESTFGASTSSVIEYVAPIAAFSAPNRTLLFEDGRVESGVDAVLFCTGYTYSYPFLSSLRPQPVADDGQRVQHTFEYLLFAAHPTLAFMMLPQLVVPFPFAEAQAAVLARLYAGRLPLPDQAAMRSWDKRNTELRGTGKPFNKLGFPSDADYINRMHDWAAKADAHLDQTCKCGKSGPYWGPRERWVRERCFKMRIAFSERGEARHQVTSLRELGFEPDEVEADNTVESTRHGP